MEPMGDMGWLWAAHKQLFPEDEMTKEQFVEYMGAQLAGFSYCYIVEDDNKNFKDGRGPIGIASVYFDGWTLTPHSDFFPWATKGNKLRALVSFLQKMRYNKDVGVTKVEVLSNARDIFKSMKKYISLKYSGFVENGDPEGKLYCYYIVGGKRAK